MDRLELDVMVEGDPRLANIYSVIVVADGREPEGARAFRDWLLSDAGRRAIAGYGRRKFAAPLYEPLAGGEPALR